MTDIIYIDKIPSNIRDKFRNKLIEICEDLDIVPDWLMVVIATESGFKTDAKNEYNCSGLIQFCPDKVGGFTKTIRGKEYNLSNIRTMNHYQQLDLIYDYYYPYKNKINSIYDLKLVTFYPKAVGETDSYILGSHNGTESNVYNANKSIAQNGHKYIQVRDIKAIIDKKIDKLNLSKEVNTITKGKKLLFRFYYIPLTLSALLFLYGINRKYKWI